MRDIINEGIKKNFALGDGSPEVWRETIRKLCYHSFVAEQDDFKTIEEENAAFSKVWRYRVKFNLVKNYILLHS
jgi:hypothetical protein